MIRRVHSGLIFRYHEVYNIKFDHKHEIDTRTSVALETLNFTHPNKAHAVDYEPTPIKLIEKFLESAQSANTERTFIDLGCGKGRVLIKAAELGFKRLIGVEFAEDIASSARENLDRALKPGLDVSWTILSEDATAFRPPENDLVIFLYNPFAEPVVEKVADWIEAHIARGYAVDVIYYNSQCRKIFDSRTCLREVPFSRMVQLNLKFLSWHRAAKYDSETGS